MAEPGAIGDGGHVLLEKERVHTLQREFLPTVPKSAARDARTDFAAQLERVPNPQYHRPIHHRLYLPTHHSHIDRRRQQQTITPAHRVQDWRHIVVVHALAARTGKASLAAVNLFASQRNALGLDTSLFQKRQGMAQGIRRVPIFVWASVYSQYIHLTSTSTSISCVSLMPFPP
jgi:hypothetical protein